MKKSAASSSPPVFCLAALASTALAFTNLAFTIPARAAPAAPDTAAGLVAFQHGRFAEAYGAWAAAAAAGDARAARYLGVLYDTGEGVRQDRGQAVAWYRRAAGLGDPAAMFNVGVSYDSGIGVGRDHAQAARWYGRAASRHYGRAEYDLALLYRAGDGVPRSPSAAARLFQAAARDGIDAAYAHLPKPPPGAARSDHVRGSATPDAPDDDGPFLEAQRALLSRQPQEAADAVILFRRAAALGGPAAAPALYDLGWCYENGIGVPADPSQAYRSYVRAAAVTDDHGLRDLAEGAAVALHASPATAETAAVSPGR